MTSPRSTVENKGAKSRNRDHDDVSFGLPGGSSLFQEVMAELHHPPSPVPQVPPPRRRKSTKVKHVHYETDIKEQGIPLVREEVQEEQEGEQPEEPERQILHGKCHCYFVQNGTVMGLADHKCHHEHRNCPSPATSPRLHRKFTTTPTPEGSPKSRHKLHPQHHSSLFPPQLEEFRGRSHSDTTAMARLSNAKRTSSLTPSATTTSHGKPAASSLQGSPPRSNRSSPDRSPVPVRRSSSVRSGAGHALANGVSQRVSSPPPILIQEPTSPGLGSNAVGPGVGEIETRMRKLSSHTVPSDQLHYLYDQFLHTGSGAASGQRPHSLEPEIE